MDRFDGPVELSCQELRGVQDVVIERGRLVAVMARIEDTFGAGSATAEAMRPTYLPPPEPDSDGDDGPGPGRGPMMYTRR